MYSTAAASSLRRVTRLRSCCGSRAAASVTSYDLSVGSVEVDVLREGFLGRRQTVRRQVGDAGAGQHLVVDEEAAGLLAGEDHERRVGEDLRRAGDRDRRVPAEQ